MMMRRARSHSGTPSIARRAAGGTAANLVGSASVIVVRLALLPVILHQVGARSFGIWALVGSIASFAFLLELGVSTALVKFVAEHMAREEVDEARGMVAAADSLFGLIGVAVAVVGTAIAFLLPWLVHLDASTARFAVPVVALTAIDTGISLPAMVPGAALKGVQRFGTYNALAACGALLFGGLVLGALWTNTGIVGVAAAGATNSAMMLWLSVIAVRRTPPGLMRPLLAWDEARAWRLIRFSRSIAAIQIAGRLQARLDAVVIAAALPVRLITPYTFAQRLSDGARIISEQFTNVVLPIAAEVSSSRRRDDLRQLFLTTSRITLATAAAAALPICLLAGHVLSLWVGVAYARYETAVVILTCAVVVDLASYPAAAAIQSIERHGPMAWMAVGGGILNVLLSVALVWPFGIDGVAAATFTATTVEVVLFVLPYTARVLGVSLREFLREVPGRLALPVAGLAGVLLAARWIVEIDTLPRLALVVVVALAVYMWAYVAIGASEAERGGLVSVAPWLARLPILRARSSTGH